VDAARSFVDAARAERAEESRAYKKAHASKRSKRKPAAVKRASASARARRPR
jgi:hypothetical protein